MRRLIMARKLKIFLSAIIVTLISNFESFAQERLVSGQVIQASDRTPVPGVSVKVKGKPGGVSTDLDGRFKVSAQRGDVLVFTSIGYQDQQITVGASSTITVTLQDDVRSLNEVVVVGYGVQQKKLVTGATVQVKGDDLQKQSQTNALQALQGQAPGVQIASTSGQPGENLKVTIRGLGTIGNAGPLYIVDGVQTGNINFLNPADIESIDVLKDAASAAIYGSQAANGVVLVTTRQGKNGQAAQITFDAYAGTQQLGRKVDLLNSSQYASLMNEAAVNSGKSPIFTNEQIAGLGTGTNWLDQMFVDNAATQNYSLGATGGTEFSTYSTSLSYTGQEGIVGGKDLSNYQRYNFKINSEHKLYKNIVTVGEHLNFSYINNNGIGVGNQYNNSLRGAFNTSPFVPMYDESGNFFDNTNTTWAGGGEANPYAEMFYGNQNRRNNQRLLGDLYFVIEPVKNLKFRSSLGLDFFTDESRSFTPEYKLSLYSFNDNSRVDQALAKGRSLMFDNLLSYSFNLNTDHNFEAMVGTSAFQYDRTGIWGINTGLVFNDLDHAWLSNATNTNGTNITIQGGPTERFGDQGPTQFQEQRLSYFSRLNYNYKQKYLLNATFRADGSSKFAKDNRWGYFPSVSAGWVLSSENFLEGSKSWLNYLKLRASWGQVGNQNITAFQYMAPITFINTNYIFGTGEGSDLLVPGAYSRRLSNADLKWETSEQADLGFDAQFLSGKLNVNFDWYNKLTKDWLIVAPILATAGADAPYINGGDVRNRGVELGINYGSNFGAFNYRIGLNGAYNKNTVGAIPSADGIIHGATNQLYNNSGEFYRAQNGHPIGYFWGLETAGLFQTQQEVVDYKSSNGKIIQPGAAPGDLRYVDQNNDGVINDLDRTEIGNPNPDYTFGISLSGSYKAFDFSLLAAGVAGNQIVQSWRNQASQYANFSSSILERWHGAGTSNSVPRVTEDNRNWINFSDVYVQNGDFLRINNLTLGYDFGKVLKKSYLKQVRIFASALNLYTFTKYNGMDPEIGYGIDNGERDRFSSGVDLGYYPRPRTFMLGANVRF